MAWTVLLIVRHGQVFGERGCDVRSLLLEATASVIHYTHSPRIETETPPEIAGDGVKC